MKWITRHQYGMVLIMSIMLYSAIIGIQGFDIADEGWSMTGFQQVFSAPDSVEYLFMYYLANIVGGLWEMLFGWAGIYGYRLLATIIVTASSWVVWRMLRPYFTPWSIILGLWAVLFSASYGIMVFYHNYLMDLLSVCAAASLFYALKTHCLRWMAVSGMIIGINVFVRLPNITLTSLILLLIPYYLYHRDTPQVWKMFGAGIGGFAIGITFVILVMMALGHWTVFINAVDSVASAGADGESNHNIFKMLRLYLGVYHVIFTQGFLDNLYSSYLFGSLCWAWVVFSRRYTKEIVYLATIAFIIMHVLPIGSDMGVFNCGENCIRLALPLLTGIVWKEVEHHKVNRRGIILLRTLALATICIYFARGVRGMMLGCYYDQGPRWEKTCRIDHPLATTFTTQENCAALDPLLHELKKYVKKDDYLLCFQTAPTIHYLTHTRPYLYNPWPWCYDPSNMELHFKRAEREIAVKPILVRDKMMIFNWAEHYPDWDNEHAEESYLHRNKKVHLIKEFISRHHYHVVWENEVFQILVPSSAKASN